MPTTPRVSLRLLPRMSTARSLGFVRLTVRFDSVLMMHLLAFAKTIRIGLAAGVLSSLARQADTLLSLLTSMLIRNHLLSSCSSRLVALTGPALDSGQRCRRQIDKLQVFSRNPGPASGSDQRALADHLHETWTHLSVLKEASFVTDRTLTEHINVITQHHCSVLLNKDTFCGTSRARRSRFCARSHVPRGPLRAWW